MKIIYGIFVLVGIFVILSLVWPFLIIAVVALVGYFYYLKYKYKQQLPKNNYQKSSSTTDDTVEKPVNDGTIIDVDYEERESE